MRKLASTMPKVELENLTVAYEKLNVESENLNVA